MDFIEIAKKRYSVRGYKDRKVEEAVSYTHLTLPTNSRV